MAVRELRGSPSMLPMFARAGVAMIPGASRLPLIGPGRSHDIPDLTLVLDDVGVDRDRLASYDKVCAHTLRDALPATYPHVLAFPLHLALMTDPSFPFPAVGLVHIENRIVQRRPVSVGERFSFRVWATPAQPHPRGLRFSIRTEARVGDELVWEEASTNLHRGPGGADAAAPTSVASTEDLPAAAAWKLPADLGRRYGSVSGDLNPIHMHALTARLFGFPAAIAHGMWTKARTLAALGARLPDAFAVEVAFRRPILLPATVVFALGDDLRFGVRDAARATQHLDGAVTLSNWGL